MLITARSAISVSMSRFRRSKLRGDTKSFALNVLCRSLEFGVRMLRAALLD